MASSHISPLLSPQDRTSSTALQRKRTLSGNSRRPDPPASSPTDSSKVALPPPPSRARKIIQMKPKQPSMSDHPGSNPAVVSSSSSSTATTKSAATGAAPASGSKRKQAQAPSATSAAGRKIARKTAHSIIERRRRSKMNEEFGVLKDMIPACAGVEMHKLAILQAGIEYVRYLEGCVEKLKAQNRDRTDHDGQEEAEEDEEDDRSMDVDPREQDRLRTNRDPSSSSALSEDSVASDRRPAYNLQPPRYPHDVRAASLTNSGSNSTYASPDLRPIKAGPSSTSMRPQPTVPPLNYTPANPYVSSPAPSAAQTPTATGVSPAFQAFQFSPDLSRTGVWSSSGSGGQSMGKPPPSIAPLPQAALPLTALVAHVQQRGGEGQAEATATAALMMMGSDRNSVGLQRSPPSGPPSLTGTPAAVMSHDRTAHTRTSGDKGKGMSVRDLLSS